MKCDECPTALTCVMACPEVNELLAKIDAELEIYERSKQCQ